MNKKRRSFLSVFGKGVIALPLGHLAFQNIALATESDRLDPEDPTAKSLAYAHESSDAAKRCGGCQFYTGAAGSKWGPCVIFPGKQVSASGVCNSWYAKA